MEKIKTLADIGWEIKSIGITERVGFLTFEQFHGKENIGSSRIRARWVAKHWPEAEEFIVGQKYDVIIFQKVYWLEYMELLTKQQPNVIKILDICDADWLHWATRITECLPYVDAVTTSTEAIAIYMADLIYGLRKTYNFKDIPVWCIPDRLDIQSFGDLKKDHKGKGDAKSVVWYEYSENFAVLNGAIPVLLKAGIEELIVIASKKTPYQIPAQWEGKIRVLNLPWTVDTVNQDLLKADIVINPKSNLGKWKFKSNNKTINAWALGMPVAGNEKELRRFISEENRIAEGEEKYREARTHYDVKQSVLEYKNLISEIKERRKTNV